MEFRPERFLTEAGQRTPMNPNKAAFGFGRRYVFYLPVVKGATHHTVFGVAFALADISPTIP